MNNEFLTVPSCADSRVCENCFVFCTHIFEFGSFPDVCLNLSSIFGIFGLVLAFLQHNPTSGM